MNRRQNLRLLAAHALGAAGAASLGAAPWVALAGISAPAAAQMHINPGPVLPPLPAPQLPFTDHLGRPQQLRAWMAGHITAVQTIFTGCSSICPLQGAVFAQAQRRAAALAPRAPLRWLSLSIDALGDTPGSLHAWLQRMGPPLPGWAAGLPRVDDVDRLRLGLDGRASTPAPAVEAHSDKVYFFDARAQLRWRTGSLPSVDEVVRVMLHLAA